MVRLRPARLRLPRLRGSMPGNTPGWWPMYKVGKLLGAHFRIRIDRKRPRSALALPHCALACYAATNPYGLLAARTLAGLPPRQVSPLADLITTTCKQSAWRDRKRRIRRRDRT